MGTVANLVVKISANSTDFEKGIASLEKSWKRTGAQLQSVGASLTKAITLPMAGIALATTKVAMDFDSAMTKVRTLASESEANIKQLRQQVLDLAPAVGIGPTQLAEALLVIESTGFRSGKAMDILRMSAEASAIGMGDAKDVARAITATINAYGAANITAAQAADMLTATVDAGGAEADQLAGELGRVVGVAAQLGVSFDQVGAFIATYTKLGLGAAEATTGLSGVLNMILNPSREARNALADIGMSADGLRASIKEKGLGEALIGLLGKVKGNGDAVGALFGNVRALAGVMGTAGTQANTYRQVLDQIQHSTGTLNDRFDIWRKTTAATWAEFKAQVQVAAISLGTQLAPAFSKVLIAAGPLFDLFGAFMRFFAGLPGPIQTVAIGLLAVAAAAGPVTYAWGAMMSAGSGVASVLRLIPGVSTVAGTAITALGGSVIGVLGPLGAFLAAWAGVKMIADSSSFQHWATTSASFPAAMVRSVSSIGQGQTFERLTEAQFAAARAGGQAPASGAMGPALPAEFLAHATANAIAQPPVVSSAKQQEAEARLKRIADRHDDLSGAKARSAALEEVAALKGIDLSKKTAEQLKHEHDILDEGIRAYGDKAPKAMQDLEAATRPNIDMLANVGDEMKNIASLAGSGLTDAMKAVTEPFLGESLDMSSMQNIEEVIASDAEFADGIHKLGQAVHEEALKQARDIEALGSAFVNFGQTLGGISGGVIGSIGGIVQAFGQFQQTGGPQGLMQKATALTQAAGAIWANTTAGGSAGTNALKGAAAGAQAGMAFGPYGAAVGAGVGALVGFVKSRIVSKDEKDARKEALAFQDELLAKFQATATASSLAEAGGERWRAVNISVRDAYLAIGKSEQDAMRDLARFNDATHVSAEAVQSAAAVLAAAFDEQAADAERLTNAIKAYGFEFSELGKQFQQKDLNNQAKELVEDWRVLVASGISMSVVNDHMAGAMNQYLQSALAVGAEVPAAMAPILKSFADQGLLVDGAGNKITDLTAAGVVFSETMTAGFDRVILKLDQLINSLIAAGTAIDPIAQSAVAQAAGANLPTVNAPAVSVVPTDNATPTGGTAVRRVPAMAAGGIVRRPTLAMIGESGPEAVVPLSGHGGGMGGLTVIFQGDVFDAQATKDKIAAWYHDAVETSGKSRSKARQLGLVGA